MELFAEQISEDLATAFFPQYEVLVFSLLVEMLDRGVAGGEVGRRVERGVMVLIDRLLSHVRLEMSPLQTRFVDFYCYCYCFGCCRVCFFF